MSADGRQRWFGMVMFVGALYLVIILATSALAGSSASSALTLGRAAK